jgi:hypothetical protein
MFIRESRKNIKGVTYTYYKLVEAFRNENGTPTNRTILDFNASDLEGINPEEYGESYKNNRNGIFTQTKAYSFR